MSRSEVGQDRGGPKGARGAGTVLTAAVCLALLGTAWAASAMVLWVGQVSAAQDAADLAALAGASAQAQGTASCDAARSAAERNGAHLLDCDVQGDEFSFVVEVRVRVVLDPPAAWAPEGIERVALAGSVQ